MRTFDWDTLPQNSVLGRHNIWTEERPPGDYNLDTQHMEELFSKRQQENKQHLSIRGPSSSTSQVLLPQREHRYYCLRATGTTAPDRAQVLLH
uniref:Uncharacterized protein n=1 Tax=Knipowitschia caucasica TaxID=637954 RepID=A0AAV2J990_KNICA